MGIVFITPNPTGSITPEYLTKGMSLGGCFHSLDDHLVLAVVVLDVR